MKRGFTLIELVMVIVILGILAATALPRFVDLSGKAKESSAKGAVGGIRAAIAIKYASNAAWDSSYLYPANIVTSLFADDRIPDEPYNTSNTVTAGTAGGVDDSGGWVYDSTTGQVWLNASEGSTY